MLKNGGRATLPGNFSRRLISADGNGKKKKKKENGTVTHLDGIPLVTSGNFAAP